MRTKKDDNSAELLRGYLKVAGISWRDFWHKFDISSIKIIFLLALRDFNENKISLNQLSEIANKLYYDDGVWNPWSFVASDMPDNRLSAALNDASEIDYYHEHKNDDSSNKKIYEYQSKKLKEYYKENKDLIGEK